MVGGLVVDRSALPAGNLVIGLGLGFLVRVWFRTGVTVRVRVRVRVRGRGRGRARVRVMARARVRAGVRV